MAPTVTDPAARPAVLLDCDPGHDDALALVVAAAYTDLVGITTVHGNAPLARTTPNAIVVRDLLGLDVPVHQGAERPLLAEPRHAPAIHGTSGLDGADLPEPSGPPASTDAVGFIVETCRATEGLWLVPTGPLTNIALALRAAPDIAGRVAGISLMGGGTFGNHTATAEFNILCDPEAAAIVFAYGGPLIMAGLHLTHQLQATPERVDALRARPGPLAPVFADLLTFFTAAYLRLHDGFGGPPVHDVAAVLALTHPQLFERRAMHVEVETAGVHTRGMTVIDQRPRNDVPAPNTEVLWTVDADAAFDVITAAV